MRLRHPQTILWFGFLIQVTVAYQKNDYLKNNQRTNPKKYHPASIAASTSRSVNNKYSVDSGNVKLRHSSSKFPHFDKLKTRIAGLDSDSGTSTVRARTYSDSHASRNRYSDHRFYNSDSRWISSDPYPRLRHHGWSNRARTTSPTTTTTSTASPDDDLFETYGDMEDDGDKVEDEDSSYDDFFDTVEDSGEENENNNFQAEEPTERPTPEPRKYSSLTEYKWVQLGTYEKVQEARRNFLNLNKSPEENNATAALEHYVRVKNQYQCKKPIPKVIPVHLEHPDPTVTYIPQCTVLHRCAEDTGCCKWDATCQFKEREEISLYFYVKNIGADYTKVKTLTFFNHTECECKDKEQGNSEDDPTTERAKRVAEISTEDQSSKFNSGITLKSGMNFRSAVPENLEIKCKCPKEFTPKIRYNSKCYCDCKEDNEDCIRMKKGKEYSGLTDRLCILNKQCGTVSCEYGSYIKEKGRCPRINEV